MGIRMKVIVLYGSFDGQSRDIAYRIAEVIGRGGHQVQVVPAQAKGIHDRIEAADAVIVGGAVRYGHHQKALERAVRDNYVAIVERPNAFFSVCMSAAGPHAKPATAWSYVDDFITRTGWQPGSIVSFAGALKWSRYGPLMKLMMRFIVGMNGGDTDTSRDHEYTDWNAVERFAAEFEYPLRERRAA
jgi:menaquinone-dependent protoporphyrinogen oxidase